MKTKRIFLGNGYKTVVRSLRPLLVMLLFILGTGNAWGGASTKMRTKSSNSAAGLVYMTKGTIAEPALNAYKVQSSDVSQSTSSGGIANFIAWAKPVRGQKFKTWADANGKYTMTGAGGWPSTNSNSQIKLNTDPSKWDGVHDTIQGGNGGQASTDYTIYAYFEQDDAYNITYAVPVGGSYSISYKYLIINSSTAFEYKTDNYSMTSATEENMIITSYGADEITLTVPAEASNFIGWYEDDVKIEGSETKKTLTYTAHANVTIEPKFKELAWGGVTGDVTTNVTAKGAYDSNTVYVAIPKLIGSWSSSEFTVTPANPSNDFGSIHIDSVTLNKTVTPNRLEITYTYTASEWGGIDATFTITPTFGATKQFSVACFAEEVVDYEACIEENEVRTYTGTLAKMMTQANSMNNKPTVKLMNPFTITTPLSFTKSMTFDVNGKELTANCASAFSVDAASIDVQIIDGSFTQVGEIHTSYSSTDPVSVVAFTQAAKLTMQGGTLSVENTGAGGAYGVDVKSGSTFYMTNGKLTVTASSGNAEGVHVATASDYATLNGGSISVTAPTNAYGLWSAGQSNVENATITVETAGANAYGVYVNGGVSTLNTTAIAATAATTNAYGAYVNAGRLNGNAGSIAASAATSDVYGIHVHGGATAMLQQNMVITAEATGASGTNVFGVDNLGTVGLTNVSVTATSPTTAATAVNSATGAVSTTIDGGTYRATAEGGTAYGLHHQYGVLTVDGGTFRAIGGGNNVYGACAVADGSIANASITGETRGTGNTAYGFVGGVANKNITLTNCAITGQSNTSKAYAIYSRANVTATGCTLTATTLGANYACGFYAENGANSSVNTNATVSSYTTQAYGVHHAAGSLSVNGGTYNVEVKQTTAAGAENSELYGLYNAASQTTNVNGASFHVNAVNTAYSQKVYGAYINGTLNSMNGEYIARGKTTVYGIYGLGSSRLTLSGNNVESTIVNGTASYGIYAKKNFSIDGDIVRAVGNATDIYALFFDASTSVGEVLDGKFSAQGNGTNGYGPLNANGTVGSVKLKGGVAKTAANMKKYAFTGYDVFTLDNTHPDYAGGYRYTIATENPGQYVCYIKNGNKYETLAAALQYTKDNSGDYTIIMTQNHTLPSGDYELPSNATLIIPRNTSQNTLNTSVPKDPVPVVEMIEEHIRLTMATGANLNVSGKIEVGGKLYSQEYGKISYNNCPYARLYMENGSMIQLNDGARLYAWGYISGNGAIKAKSGSKVYEMFQVGDMPAISPLGQHYLNNDAKHFPVQVYSVQNIEVPTTYYYNSELITAMYEYNPGSVMGGYNGDGDIHLIGNSGAMFQVTSNDESSWVRKSFSGGRQIYEVNSSAKLGSLVINVGSYVMNSANYILPITSTMKIHVLDGNMEITQSTMFQPGTQVEINKTAKLTIKDKDNNGNDVKVYIVDQHQWMSSTSNPDAALFVHGKIDVQGYLYTTNKGKATSKTDGANIYSTNEDAGTIAFSKAAPSSNGKLSYMMTDYSIKDTIAESAKLRNGNDSYATTAGTTSGEAWVYMNNEWVKTYTNKCFEVIENSEGATVYAKPSEYVALANKTRDANNKWIGVAETNHTYKTATNKILILMDDCQWWEVEATSDPAVFECKKEGYEGFYAYNNSTSKWELKTVNVTFYIKETGTDTNDKIVSVGWKAIPDQAVIATNPTKETTAEYTYAFYGWKSSVTGEEYKWTDKLEVATADMSYRPVFTATKRNYTITLKNANNGVAVPVEVPYGEVPSYTPKKDADAQYTYTFEGWTPALQAVNGPATYTANWSSVVNRYTITWMDGETVLETDKNQAYGTATSFGGTLPTKEADNEFAYSFSGWKSSLTGSTYANGSTPTVGGATTYTAQYTTTPRYKITFANYDGTDLQKDYYVTQGENPVFSGLTPGRKRDLDGYYKFTGWKNSAGDPFEPSATLPAVTGKETYTAQYAYVTELYTITLNNIDGAGGTWSGKFGEDATPFYNRDNNDVAVEPAKASTDANTYEFDYWIDESDTHYLLNELPAVTAVATYTAHFAEQTRKYDITFANLDGNGAQQTIEVEHGTTPVSPVTPTKEEGYNTYAFTGWSPAIASVSGDATYTAQFSGTPTVRQAKITFDLDNGSTPTVVDVDYGTMPAWSGATPTKAADAQYTYTFAGWYPALGPVTGDETYSAQYTQTLNSYTVRFVNYDGTELQSSEFVYGSTPAYSDETPKRPADVANRKVYTFDGWSSTNGGAKLNTLPAVNGVATYYAHYSEATIVAIVTPESGTPYYATSWADAYNHISDNCTLKLYADATPNENTAINKNMTLDLNGYTLSKNTSSTSNTQLLNVSKALTIMDSGEGGKITYTGSSRYGYKTIYVNGSTASLIINSGSIQATNTRTSSNNNGSTAANAVEVASSATLTINGGELIATSTKGNARAVNNNNTNVTITGGKLKVTGNATLNIFNSSNVAKVTASGGYYSKDPGSISIVTGYEKVATSELSGYTYKVTPKTNIQYTVKHWQQNIENDEYTEVTADREMKQGTTATATAAEAKDYTGFTAQPFEQGTIAGDGSTVVNIYYNRNKHTVTWLNGETAIETDENVKFGTTPSYDGETPTKIREDYTCVFTGWSPEIVPLEDHNTTYTAQFEETPLEFVVVDERPVNVTTDVTSTTVTTTGDLEVTEGNTLTTTDLVLEASLVDDEGVSGEIRGAGTVTPIGNVYFDLTLNTWARHWRAFGVPWKIASLRTTKLVEIKTKNGTPCYNELVLGRDYDIVYYNGATRAQQGPGRHCWDYVEDGDGTLDPGKAYLIGFIRPTGTVRFTKAEGAPIRRSNETLDVPYYEGNGVGTDAGWNAIANPKTYHATMNAGVEWCHVHNGDTMRSDGFTTKQMSEVKFVVGTAVFVQANPDKSVVDITRQHHSPSAPAPRRVAAHEDAPQYHAIHIMANNKSADRIYIKADEDKETDSYTNGIDVAKMGISTVRAQIWVDRYNTQLAVNTMAPVNNTVSYPLGISVPQAGEYEIRMPEETSDMVYLTYDDRVIWNLSYAPYTADLEKGTNSHYGIRMVVSRTPAVATGFDEALVDAQGETKKVLIKDKVCIIRGENVYSVDGQLVK